MVLDNDWFGIGAVQFGNQDVNVTLTNTEIKTLDFSNVDSSHAVALDASSATQDLVIKMSAATLTDAHLDQMRSLGVVDINFGYNR